MNITTPVFRDDFLKDYWRKAVDECGCRRYLEGASTLDSLPDVFEVVKVVVGKEVIYGFSHAEFKTPEGFTLKGTLSEGEYEVYDLVLEVNGVKIAEGSTGYGADRAIPGYMLATSMREVMSAKRNNGAEILPATVEEYKTALANAINER